ncbi:beta-lactamase [Pseudohyphozyma bogoriensis]|nr:beta-lactamase [Pseudohyphozyma bogoriensis]
MSFSASAAASIDASIQQVTADPYHGLPRASVLVASKDEILYEGSGGYSTLPPYSEEGAAKAVAEAPKVTVDSTYDLYSATKLIAVIAALQLVEKGSISLDDDAAQYVEELKDVKLLKGFKNDGEPILETNDRVITVEMLINHSAGFGYPFTPELVKYLEWTKQTDFDVYAPESSREFLASHPLVYPPGENWTYGMNNDWLGLVVEAVSGKDLETYFQDHIFKPLGITDISFLTNLSKMDIAHSGSTPSSPYTFAPGRQFNQSQFLGRAGLSGSPKSYLKIIQAILAGGGPLLKRSTVDLMFQPSLKKDQQRQDVTRKNKPIIHPYSFKAEEAFPGNWGYGGFLTESDLPSGRTKGTLSWSGAANTFWIIDRNTGVAFVIFTNTLPSRPPQLWPFWEEVENAIYAGFKQ